MKSREEIDEFIQHYGVPGMKWGVRKAQKQENSPAAKARRMSDAELRSAVERLKLEQQYVQINHSLTPSSPVKELLKKHGNQMTSIAIGSATSFAVGLALKKAFKNAP